MNTPTMEPATSVAQRYHQQRERGWLSRDSCDAHENDQHQLLLASPMPVKSSYWRFREFRDQQEEFRSAEQEEFGNADAERVDAVPPTGL